MSIEEQLTFINNMSNAKYKISYIREDDIFWFRATDLKQFGFSNVHKTIQDNTKYDGQTKTIKCLTSRGEQNCNFISYSSLKLILLKSRKHKVVEFLEHLGESVTYTKISCLEADSISCIVKSFNGETMIEQYHIGKFLVDLYFPKYLLAVECDDNTHKFQIKDDIVRENNIRELLPNVTFIRFNPEEKNFCIFNVINLIYSHIKTQ